MVESTRRELRRILIVLVGFSVVLLGLASAAYLCRHGVLLLGWTTDLLTNIQHESGFAYVAPTHRVELSGRERPSSAVVLENGIRLAGPAGAQHKDIRDMGKGRFSFWGETIYFSSSDNSVPGLNGRCYEIRYPRMVSGRFALVIYISMMLLGGITLLLGTTTAEGRELGRAVLSFYVWPSYFVVAALSGITCVLLGLDYMNRRGMLGPEWKTELLAGIRPEFGSAKTYLSRAMEVSGLLLCLGALIVGLFEILRVRIPLGLGDMAKFSADLLKSRWRLMLSCILLGVAGVLWCRAHPLLQPARALETIIVEEQLERARTIKGADVIVIGDSSALMGVDAKMLGHLLGGRRVENLSTLGWVGANGYAHLLELYFERGLKAEAVVLLMHGVSLDRPEKAWDGWEDWVVRGHVPGDSAKNSIVGFRSKLSSVFFGRLFALPMPEAWGRYYGTHFDLGDTIRENNGSIYQPLLALPAETRSWDSAAEVGTTEASVPQGSGLTYRLSPSAEAGLRQFALIASKMPVEHVFFGITPTLLSSRTEQAVLKNGQVAQEVGAIMRGSLRGRFYLLKLVPFRGDEYFASNTHMNEMGREHFTRTLAGVLAGKM